MAHDRKAVRLVAHLLDQVQEQNLWFAGLAVDWAFAELLALGFSRRRVTVVLESDGDVAAQREVLITPDKARYRVRFQFVPQRVGKYVYRVVAPAQAGEALRTRRDAYILASKLAPIPAEE